MKDDPKLNVDVALSYIENEINRFVVEKYRSPEKGITDQGIGISVQVLKNGQDTNRPNKTCNKLCDIAITSKDEAMCNKSDKLMKQLLMQYKDLSKPPGFGYRCHNYLSNIVYLHRDHAGRSWYVFIGQFLLKGRPSKKVRKRFLESYNIQILGSRDLKRHKLKPNDPVKANLYGIPFFLSFKIFDYHNIIRSIPKLTEDQLFIIIDNSKSILKRFLKSPIVDGIDYSDAIDQYYYQFGSGNSDPLKEEKVYGKNE